MNTDFAIASKIYGADIVGTDIKIGTPDNNGQYPFHVDKNGFLTAQGAELSGRFTVYQNNNINMPLIDVNDGQIEFYNSYGHVGTIGKYTTPSEKGLAILCDYDKKLCLGHRDSTGVVVNDVVIDRKNKFPIKINGVVDNDVMFAPEGTTVDQVESGQVRGLSIRSGLITNNNLTRISQSIFKTDDDIKGVVIEDGLIKEWEIKHEDSISIMNETIKGNYGLITENNLEKKYFNGVTKNGLVFANGVCIDDNSSESESIEFLTGIVHLLISVSSSPEGFLSKTLLQLDVRDGGVYDYDVISW